MSLYAVTSSSSDEEGIIPFGNPTPALPPENSRSLTCRVTTSVLSLFGAAGGIVASSIRQTLLPSHSLISRITGTFAPAFSGISFYSFFSSILPPQVMRRIRVESLRVGIPLYFLLTQLYLNCSSEEDEAKEAIIGALLTLSGFEIAALVDSIIVRVRSPLGSQTEHLLEDIVDEEETLDREEVEKAIEEPSRRRTYTLVTGTTRSLAFRIPYRLIIASGLLAGSFYVVHDEDTKFMRAFSAYYFGQILSLLPLDRLIHWGEKLEQDYEKALQSNSFAPLPAKLRSWRIMQKVVSVGGPFTIAGLFIHSRWYTMGLAGATHTIREEMQRSLFQQSTRRRTTGIWRQARPSYPDITYRVARYLACAGGLTYFTIEVIRSKEPVDIIAGSTFTASVIIGFIKNAALITLSQRVRQLPLVDHLFYNGAYSGEDILGLKLLYLYLYSLFHIKIGSSYINDLNLKKALIVFMTWAGYGVSMGGDMARAEFNPEPSPTMSPNLLVPMWDWLMVNNFLALYQSVIGEVTPP